VVARGDERLRVVFGTKGGRPRDTTVVRRDELVCSLNAAVAYASENADKLVDKAGLRSAIDRYRNVSKDAGLTGKEAPHSLRYAYSREASEWHMKNGLSKKEAEAMVSMDLGHGANRHTYIKNIYNL